MTDIGRKSLADWQALAEKELKGKRHVVLFRILGKAVVCERAGPRAAAVRTS